jgi:pentose-5-phosphate-3-epimerase
VVEAGAEILVAGNAVFGRGQAEADARRIVEACA